MFTIRNYTDADLGTLLDFVIPRPAGGNSSDADRTAHRSVFADIMRLPGRDQERDCRLLFEDGDERKPTLRGFCLVFPELSGEGTPDKRSSGGRCVLNIHAAPGERYEEGWRALLWAGVERTREVGAAVAHIALWPPYDRAPALVEEGFEMARVHRVHLAWA